MNTQTHFKIEHQDEIRRFSCQPDFAILETTIKTLLCLDSQASLSIKYADEEEDLCTISNPAELSCAVSCFPVLLRLKVEHCQQQASKPTKPTKAQVLERQTAQIKQRLENETLPLYRAESLNARLQRLRSKLAIASEAEPEAVPVPKGAQNSDHKENTELLALKAIVVTKRTALQEARKNKAAKSQIEVLLQDLIDARNNFRTKKPMKGEIQCSKNPEIMGLRTILVAKRTALQNARKNGAPQSEVEVLLQDLVDARTNLLAKKKAQNGANKTPEFHSLKSIVVAKRAALQEARKNGASKAQLDILSQELVDARVNLIENKKNQPHRQPKVEQTADLSDLKAILVAKRIAFQDAKKNGADKSEIDRLSQERLEARKNFQASQPRNKNKVQKQDSPDVAALKAEVVAKRQALQAARKNGLPKSDIQVLATELASARTVFLAKKAATA